jgi:hypothetical protein
VSVNRHYHTDESTQYLFLGGEIIDNVEEFPNLLGCLSFDHVGDSLAAHVAVDDVRMSGVATQSQRH